MTRSELALRQARRAYAWAHLRAALRGLGLATTLTALAVGLHQTSSETWLIAAALAATLAALGWHGGAWRRGGVAGVIAGLPPMIAPSLLFALTRGGHCMSCHESPGLACAITCLGTSALVGVLVGHRAAGDRSPRAFAVAAIVTAGLTGGLACGSTGIGGAIGVAIGLVAGGVTGWVFAGRAVQA